MFGSKKQDSPAYKNVDGISSAENTRILALVAQDYLKDRKSKRRWGLFFRLLIVGYLSVTTFLYFSTSRQSFSDSHVAIVDIDGIIGPGGISAETVNQSLNNAFESVSAKGVILRINSPGGTPVQAARINEEIIRLKTRYSDKPVYVAISDICASGGYYIAVAADQIFAHPSSIVGSIGVLMNSFGFVETMKKLGIERRLITAGDNKSILDPFSPLNNAQLNHAKSMLDDVHQQFISAVKNGRGDRIGNDPDIYSGLFWSGAQARELGLIDQFGSAETIARDVLGVEKLINYTVRPKFIETFTRQLGASIQSMLLKLTLSIQ